MQPTEITEEEIDSIYVYLENFLDKMTLEEVKMWYNFLEENDKSFNEDE